MACLDIIKQAYGKDLSDEEITPLLEALQARASYLRAKNLATDQMDAALKAADSIADDLKQAAIIERRNAAMNQAIALKNDAFVRSFGKLPDEALEALLVGSNRAKQGAKQGAAQVQEAIRQQYLSGYMADIERTGHRDILASGTMDLDIMRALYAIGREQDLSGIPKEAVDLARVFAKWQEVMRGDANRAGAWIGKEEGYIMRQSHDPERIKGAGKDEDFRSWREVAARRFDLDRMAAESGITDIEDYLRGLWRNLASGNHLKADNLATPTGFKGPGNIARKLSKDRVIHFKSADDFYAYNQQFGTGNLRESMEMAMNGNASSIGLMRVLGTNPQGMFDAIRDKTMLRLRAAEDFDGMTRIDNARGRLDRYMSVVDGSMNIPGNQLFARWSGNIRTAQMLAKLGGMVLSQFNDLAVYASGTSYQGRGFFSGMKESFTGLGRSLSGQELKDTTAAIGVSVDNMVGELGRAGAFGSGRPGWLANRTREFMRLNLSTWWTSRMRASAMLGMSHHMSLQSSLKFDELNDSYKRLLSLYDIDAAKWDVIRVSSQSEMDGKGFITPEGLDGLGDDAFAAYLSARGEKVSPAAITRAKDEIGQNLRSLFTDQTSLLALEPDQKVRAIILQGTQPGTATGELMRFMMQFKSFTGAYLQRIVGRELYGRGYEGDSLLGALKNGNGEFTGFARLLVTSTLLGYASMVAKDLAKGKEPRDPTDEGMAVKVMMAAMVQGGGLGIFGDFLFGEASRTGAGTIETVGGPVISTAGRAIDLYHKAMAGDDVAARAVNEAISNTPFVNLFYLRFALNYMGLYQFQEWMNPGYLRRMERNAEKENQQKFWLRPSEVVQ